MERVQATLQKQLLRTQERVKDGLLRQKAALRAAKKRGKKLGRPPVLSNAQIAHAKTAINAKRETVSGMAEILGVNRSTVQRAMNRDAGTSV